MLVSKEAASRSPSKLYLEEGTSITVEDAVMALIIKSANDVATVVLLNIYQVLKENFAKLNDKICKKNRYDKNNIIKMLLVLPNRAQLTTARDISILITCT